MRTWAVAIVLLQLFGARVNEKNKEGAELYEEERFDEALVAFTQAQEQSPDAAEIHYNIGNVHFRKQEMAKALEEYRTALDGSPEVQTRAHFNSGNVHYQAQNYAEAIEEYKKALRIDDQDLEARQNLELALQKLQEQQQQQQQQQQQEGEQSSEGDEEQQQGQRDPSQGEQAPQQDPSPAPSQEEQMNPGGEPPQPQSISREEAERILAALAEMERAEQRRQQEEQRRRSPGTARDW